jgi:hypothetical protein
VGIALLLKQKSAAPTGSRWQKNFSKVVKRRANDSIKAFGTLFSGQIVVTSPCKNNIIYKVMERENRSAILWISLKEPVNSLPTQCHPTTSE